MAESPIKTAYLNEYKTLFPKLTDVSAQYFYKSVNNKILDISFMTHSMNINTYFHMKVY